MLLSLRVILDDHVTVNKDTHKCHIESLFKPDKHVKTPRAMSLDLIRSV
jgi:hypothetical protein